MILGSHHILLSGIAAVLLATASQAFAKECPVMLCSYANKPITHVDKRVKTAADCSFSGAGDDFYSFLSGTKATDIGNGLVGQRLVESGCGRTESVLIVDCKTKETAAIDGLCVGTSKHKDKIALSDAVYSADLLFPPYGGLRLTSDSTYQDVLQVALANNYRFKTDTAALNQSRRSRNKINPFCGCKLFYPNSIGANK